MKIAVTRRKFCSDVVATSVVAGMTVPLSAADADKTSKAKPFVKWAGGKGQLLQQLEALLPADLANRPNLTYVEPFVGGGAMAFHLLAKYDNITKVILNDFNRDLVSTYRTIRDVPDELLTLLARYQSEYRQCGSEERRKEYYLQKRAAYNRRDANDVGTAALFIFLNRTCFNGLYRVNSKGLFNVPFGKSVHPMICDTKTILADSKLLQGVEILNGDFEGVYRHMRGRAFVYLDPPYRPLPKTPSFTAYSKEGFNDDQQRRLADFCRRLDREGHQWLQSNSDPANTDPDDMFFDRLYEGFDIRRVSASRMINSKAEGRGKITELAIRNYRE